MALFSELAQAMNLMYNITHETNQNDDDDFVLDYNTFSQGLNDTLPGYESEQPSSLDPSDKEDEIDFVNDGHLDQQDVYVVNDDMKENQEPVQPSMQENSDLNDKYFNWWVKRIFTHAKMLLIVVQPQVGRQICVFFTIVV